MVDENFKIGLSLELEEDSLESITRQVQRRINDLFKQPGGRAAGPPVRGGTATVRSAGQAISVDSREIGKAVADAVSKETSGFAKASQEVVKAVNALTRVIERQGGGPPGGGGPGPGRPGGGGGRGRPPRDDLEQRIQDQRARVTMGRSVLQRQAAQRGHVSDEAMDHLRKQEEKLVRLEKVRESRLKRLGQAEVDLDKAVRDRIAAEKALARRARREARREGAPRGVGVSGQPRRADGPRERLAARAQGRSNSQRAADIDASRAGGAPARAGGGNILADAPRRQDRRTGGEADRPQADAAGKKAAAAREAVAEPVQTQVVGQVSQSIKELRDTIRQHAPADVNVDDSFFERVGLGLKTVAKIGEGAGASIEGLGKDAKHVHATLVIAGREVVKFGNTISDAASRIVNDTERWEKAGRIGRRDPMAYEGRVRGMMREIGETAPTVQKDLPLAPYAKGGEVKVLVQLDAEQQKRINALDQEADRQAELNRILYEASTGSSELAKQLKSLGIELLTTAGLSEDIAGKRANFREIRAEGEDGRPGPIEAIETVMQGRGLAEIGPGGRGAVKAQRMAQAFRLGELQGGTIPGVVTPREEELYGAGAMRPGAFQEVKAALFDPSVLAETFEDQFLFDPNVFKPVLKESSAVVVKNLADGIEVGSKVLKDQVVGKITDTLTDEVKGITPDFKALEGTVKSIEPIMIDGVEGVKVVFESLNDAVTGMKITERGGSKGIARAAPGMAGKLGLPEDVGLAISSRAVGARANIRTMTEMISNNISDATGEAAKEISEKIFSAMNEGGLSFYEAGMKVAKELGLVEIPGVHEITQGPLTGQRVVTGRVAVGRLPDHGEKGLMSIKERHLGGPDITALRGRADTARFADEAVANIRTLTDEFGELDRTLAALTGDTEYVNEQLRKVFPEELNRLPEQAAHSLEELKNTLADPAFKEAFELQVPTREGGTRGMRISAVGARVGERDIYSDALGGVGAGKLTKLFDQIVEQATAARVAMGQVQIEEGTNQMKEASEVTSKKLRDLATEVAAGAKQSEEGAQRAREFVAQFRPLVEALGEGPAGLKYEIGGRERSVKRSAAGYVDFLDEKMTKPRSLESQVYAISDLLGERAATGGSKAQLGAVHKNVEVLQGAMDILGVVLEGNSEAAEKAISRLEKLEEELMDFLAGRALGAGKPNEEVGRTAAQAKEAGVLRGPIGTIINFAVDSKDALEALGMRLLALRDAGVDVDAALASVEKNLEMQETGFLKIGRDELLINRKDFENWAADMAKSKGMSLDEAKRGLLEQPVATGRYPITGARSIVPKKLRVVGDDVLPKGHLGVGGISPTASKGDLENILGAAESIRGVLVDEMDNVSQGLAELTKSGRGASSEANDLRSQLASLREDLSKLNGEISAIIPAFEGAGQNADFDGDKMFAAGLAADKATGQLESFSDALTRLSNQVHSSVQAGPRSLPNVSSFGIEPSASRIEQQGVAREKAEYVAERAKHRTGAQDLEYLVSSLAKYKGAPGISAEPSVRHRALEDAVDKLEAQGRTSGDYKLDMSEMYKRIKDSLSTTADYIEEAGKELFVYRDLEGVPRGVMRVSDEGVDVGVDPEYQGRGIATGLYAAAAAKGYDISEISGKTGFTPEGASFTQNLETRLEGLSGTTQKATAQISTLADEVAQGAVSFRGAWAQVAGAEVSKGGMGDWSQIEEYFGRIAKGRVAGVEGGRLQPVGAELIGKEAHAHVAGKKSVGLLTDMFNRMLVSIQTGTGEMSDAMEAGVGAMMLGINESLAQKHGSGGATGPGQFLSALRKGQLGDIKEGLGSGEGFLGKLNKQWGQVQEEMKNRLYALDLEGLREFAGKHGLAGKFEEVFDQAGGNLMTVADSLVDELDLYNIIKQMFEQMKENAKAALMASGLSEEEAIGKISASLRPTKKGFIPGLDQNLISEHLAPGYAATRSRGQAEISEMTAMEKAAMARQMIKRPGAGETYNIGQELSEALDGPMGNLSQLLESVKAFIDQSLGQVTRIPQEQLEARFGKGTRGVHLTGKDGGPGRVAVSSEVIGEGMAAFQVLEGVLEGTVDASVLGAKGMEKLRASMLAMVQLPTHEFVHRESKVFKDSVMNMVRQLNDANSAFGQNASAIEEFIAKKKNLKQSFENLAKMQTKVEAGESVNFRGIRGAEGLQVMQQEIQKLLAEELMAVASEGRLEEYIGKVPAALKEAILEQLNLLANARPEVFGAAAEAMEMIRTAAIDGLIDTASGRGPDAARAAAGARIDDNLQFAGRGTFVKGIELLQQQEAAIMGGRRYHRLAGAETGPEGGLKTTGKPELPGAMSEDRKLQEYWVEYLQLLKTMEEMGASMDPDALKQLNSQFNRIAGKVQQRMRSLNKQTGMKELGIEPFKEFQKMHREWSATQAQSMTNRAQELRRQIAEMAAAGKVDMPEFDTLMKEFMNHLKDTQDYFQETLQPKGKSHEARSFLTTAGGVMLPEAAGLGMEMRAETYQQAAAAAAGPGEEGEDFLKRYAGLLENVINMTKAGATSTEMWSRIWSSLEQHPETMQADLHKIQQYLGDSARIIGYENGQFSESAKHLQEVSKWAKRTRDSLEGIDTSSIERIAEVLMSGSKQQKVAVARALGGGDTQESMRKQMEAIQASVEERRQTLKKMAEGGDLDAFGPAGREFEGQQFELIDPKTGQVIQKFSAQFRRFGKDVKVVFNQAGAAANSFGNQMRNAFRRVVQWGLASGIVYGTSRALRDLVSVMTEVETRVTNLKKVMDLSVTNFEAMQDSAVEMGQTFGIAVEEVLDGMVVYAQQGLKMNEIMDRTKATMLAVNVTTLSATEATEALTAAQKLFGYTVDSSTRFVDMWGSVAAKHAITAKDLALATQRSGAAAKAAGVEYQDFMGIVTAIGAVTRQTGKEIATGTKFMFRAMRRPTAQKELMGLGIQSQTGGGDLRPAMDVLGDLAGKWGDLSKAQQLSTAQAMAGIRHYNQFIVLMENFQEVLDASADAQNSQGFATRRNAVAMQTFTKQMQVLREQVKEVALDIGKLMLPSMQFAVRQVQKLVEVLNMLPDVMKQFGLAGAAGFVAFGRGADVVLDTMDAFGGQKFTKTEDGFQKLGAVARLKGLGQSLKGFGGTITEVWAGKEIAEDAGFLSKRLLGLVKSFKAMGTAARVASVVGVGAMGALIGVVGWWIANAPKTGKALEEGLAPGIGAAMDQADALSAAQTRLKGLGLQATRAAQAVAKASDPAALKTAVDEGSFKDPIAALRDLRDNQAEFAQGMAKSMPGMVKGMNEFGEYTLIASDAFTTLSVSAADFARADAFAGMIDAMAGYNKELVTAIDLSDRIREKLNQMVRWGAKISEALGIEMPDTLLEGDVFGADTLLEKYQNITAEVDRLAALRESGANVEDAWSAAIERQIELRGQVIERLKETKRILEEMPVFESMDMAAANLGPQLAEELRQSVDMGIFGRGATMSSVMFKQMGKSAGFGGMLDYESAATPGGTLGALLAKGVGVGSAQSFKELEAATGNIIITSSEAAKSLLEMTGAMQALDPRLANEAVTAAQQLIVEVDEKTGEEIYRFYDAVGQTWKEANRETMNEVAGGISEEGRKLAVISRESMERAMEATRRILTMQFTGAMAGIRVPGNVDIGPARFSEVTSNQRMMGTLVEEMQELSDIQNNITQKAKEFNEEMSAEGLTEGSKQIKALGSDMLKVIMDLQQKGFKLSVIAHYTQAMHDLNKTLEDSAEAARRVMVEQQAAYDASMHFAGALKGLQVMPQLDLGKSMRELSGLERAQLANPAIGGAVATAAAMQQRATSQQQRQVEATMMVDDINQMIRDLESRGEALTEEQKAKRLELAGTGMTAETAEIVASILESSASEVDVATQSYDVQVKMLEGIKNVELTLIDQTKVLAENAKLQDKMEKARGMDAGPKREAAIADIKKQRQRLFDRTLGDALLGDVDAMFKAGGADTAKMRADAMYRTLGVAPGEEGFEARGAGAGRVLDEEGKKTFEEFRQRWLEAKQEVMEASEALASERESGSKLGMEIGDLLKYTPFQNASADLEQAQQRLGMVESELLGDTDIANFYTTISKSLLAGLAEAENKAKAAGGTTEEVDLGGLDRKMSVYRNALQRAQDRAMQGMDQTTKAFNEAAAAVSEPWRIVDAVGNFAKSIEDQINAFKKAEMLHYDKIDSDLEGPFARVGQPGFRTSFDQRRSEIEARQFGGPRTLDQMRADQAELAKVEYDEKEARIKQAQDKEVAALKQQQSQAENLRSVMADALIGGDLEGTGLEGMTRGFMDQLTDQLATSEQAEMRGGELFFKGVPALEDASRFLQKIKEIQEKRAQEAAVKTQQMAQKPIVDQLMEHSTYLKQLVENTKKAGDAAQTGIPMTSENVRGMPGTGTTTAVTATGTAANVQSAAMVAARPAPLPSGATPVTGGIGGYGLNLEGVDLSGAARHRRPTGDLIGTFGGTDFIRGKAAADPGMFVREQTLKLKTGNYGGRMTETENLLTMAGIEARSPAAMSFSPTGSAKGMSTFSNLAEKATGLSNYNQLTEAASRKFGNPTARTGAQVSTDQGTPGSSVADRTVTGEGGGTADVASIVQEAIGSLAESLNRLTTEGITLPGEVTSALTGLGSEITDALTGDPLDVNIAASAATVPVADAAVADRLTNTLSVSVPDGVAITNTDAIALDTSAITEALSAVDSSVQSVAERVETGLGGELTVSVTNASEIVNTETLATSLETAITNAGIGTAVGAEVQSAVAGLPNEIATAIAGADLNVTVANESLNTNATIVNTADIQSALAGAIDSSGLGSVGAAAADSALRLDVIESIIDVEGGRPVSEQINLTVQEQTQTIQNEIDALSTEVTDVTRQVNDEILGGVNGLPVVRGKAESALSIAQNALNAANTK